MRFKSNATRQTGTDVRFVDVLERGDETGADFGVLDIETLREARADVRLQPHLQAWAYVAMVLAARGARCERDQQADREQAEEPTDEAAGGLDGAGGHRRQRQDKDADPDFASPETGIELIAGWSRHGASSMWSFDDAASQSNE